MCDFWTTTHRTVQLLRFVEKLHEHNLGLSGGDGDWNSTMMGMWRVIAGRWWGADK